MKHGSCKALLIAVLYFGLLIPGRGAWADEVYVGEIHLFAYNFCPKEWLPADGRILPVQEYVELFSLYGNTYGGDGRNNFAVPDLRGRVPVGTGMGPGRSAYPQGEVGGEERSQLSQAQLPRHVHEQRGRRKSGEDHASLAMGEPRKGEVREQLVDGSGGSLPHYNLPPYQSIRYCIAYKGYYPPRNQ